MKELRHHMALMYRSAQTNEDRTSILMYNNPIPDFSDMEGIEGPKRYWPSWVDDQVCAAYMHSLVYFVILKVFSDTVIL